MVVESSTLPSNFSSSLDAAIEDDISAHVGSEKSLVRSLLSRIGTQNGFVLHMHGSLLLPLYAFARKLPVERSHNVVGVRIPTRVLGVGDDFSFAYLLTQHDVIQDQLERIRSDVRETDFFPYEHSARSILGLEGNYRRS